MHSQVGEVVLIKEDKKNRGKWSIGVVEQFFEGRDEVVAKGVSLRKEGNSRIERAVQHPYPLERVLSCADEE